MTIQFSLTSPGETLEFETLEALEIYLKLSAATEYMNTVLTWAAEDTTETFEIGNGTEMDIWRRH